MIYKTIIYQKCSVFVIFLKKCPKLYPLIDVHSYADCRAGRSVYVYCLLPNVVFALISEISNFCKKKLLLPKLKQIFCIGNENI